jgi:CRISPR/Cas system-associated exonuclease Cas4 (RecB family)
MLFCFVHCMCLQLKDALDQQAARLQAEAAQQLAAGNATHTAQVQQMQQEATSAAAEHAKQLQALQDAHSKATAGVKQQHEQQLLDLQDRHKAEVQRLQASAQSSQHRSEQALRWVGPVSVLWSVHLPKLHQQQRHICL